MITQGYETGSANLNNIPLGYYYYAIPKKEINNATYLGFVNTIENLTYNPFIEMSDIQNIIDAPFERTKYGEPLGGLPKCYAIRSFDVIDKELQTVALKFNDYNNDDIRLEGYPFKYYLLTDYVNPPLLIKPELVEDDLIKIRVKTTPLSIQAKFNLYVDNYKNDSKGNLEGINNSISFMLPVASSMYSQYMSTSSASYNQNMQNLLLENDKTLNQSTAMTNLNYRQNAEVGALDTFTSVMSNTISALTGNFSGIGGAIGTGIRGNIYQNHLTENRNMSNTHTTQNHQLNEYQITASKQAKIRDLLNTPLSIKSSGNDTIFNMVNSNYRVDLIEYDLYPNVKKRISNYFKRYGYKFNSYTQLYNCIYARPHYNYVKTNVCNIITEKVPHNYLEQIKGIFNNGVTLWHMDNNTELLNYEQENN